MFGQLFIKKNKSIKPHKDVMKAIRKMDLAWTEVYEGKISLSSRTVIHPNGDVREVPTGMRS